MKLDLKVFSIDNPSIVGEVAGKYGCGGVAEEKIKNAKEKKHEKRR